MDTPREAMDKAIPKKTGIQKKHFGYLANRDSNCCAYIYGIFCRSYIYV